MLIAASARLKTQEGAELAEMQVGIVDHEAPRQRDPVMFPNAPPSTRPERLECRRACARACSQMSTPQRNQRW